MTVPVFSTRGVVLFAYLLAAILPVLLLTGGQQPTQAEHARTMAMAGHVAPMPGMGQRGDPLQQLLCQQHCLVAAATLPVDARAPDRAERADAVDAVDVFIAASLSIPPPGRPPKVAVI